MIINFRCKLPEWENDTFSPFSEVHNQSIYQWIPVDKDGILDSCKIYTSKTVYTIGIHTYISTKFF